METMRGRNRIMTIVTRKQQIVTEVGRYAFTSFLAHSVSVVAAVLSRKLLGPFQMGIWATLQVVLTYASHSALGTTFATLREIPFFEGKGDRAKATHIRNVVITFSLSTSLLVAAGIIFLTLLMQPRLKSQIFYGLFFVSAMVILERVNNLLITILRAYKEFALAAKQMFLSALINLVLIIVLTYRFQLFGFLMASCLSFIFNIAYILSHYHLELRWSFDIGQIRQLISYGFILMLIAFTSSILLTIDRVMIVKMLGFEALGLYTIAVLTWGYVYTFPNAVAIIFIPNFQERFGQNEQVKDLKSYVSKSVSGLSNSVPFFLGLAWFLAPGVIEVVLPKFSGGIGALKYLVLGAFFAALYQPFEHFMIAIRKPLAVLPIGAVTVLLAVMFNWLAIRGGYGIVGVAVATSSIALFKFTLVYFVASQHLFSAREMWINYIKVIGQFVYLFTILWFLQGISFIDTHAFLNAVLRSIIFVVLYFPFFIKLNSEFDVLSTLSLYLRGRLSGVRPAHIVDS